MVRISDINAQRKAAGATPTNVRYNSRTADANAQVQQTKANMLNLDAQKQKIMQQNRELEARLAAGDINTTEYNATHKVLSDSVIRLNNAGAKNQENVAGAQQQLNNASAVYNNQAAGLGTSYNTQTGQSTGVDLSMGEIEKSARERIAGDNQLGVSMTGQQAEEQYQTSKAEAKATMSNTGLPGGTEFRASPRALAEAKKKAATEARIAGIKGFDQIPVYNKDTGELVGYKSVENKDKTQQMQDEARTAAENNLAAGKNLSSSLIDKDAKESTPGAEGAADLGVDDTHPDTNPDAFLQGLSELEQKNAGSVMAPLFSFYKGQYKALQARGLRGEALISAMQQKTDEYVAQQRADMNGMEKAWTAMYDKIEQSSLDSAQRTYDQQSRLAEQQKQADQIEYERAIRDQNIKNEEDRQRLLLGNGISGGWRSSMHTSKMIDAFKKADRIVTDLQEDKIMNSDKWTNKMIDVEQDFHANVTAAYDAHNVNLLTLTDKLSERARDIDKTVYSNDINQLQAIDKLTNDWYDGISKISEGTTNTVIQIQKDTLAAAQDAKNDIFKKQDDLRSDMQFAIANGTINNQEVLDDINDRREELGMARLSGDLTTYTQLDREQKEAEKRVVSQLVGKYIGEDGTDYGMYMSRAIRGIANPQSKMDSANGFVSVWTGGSKDAAKEEVRLAAYESMGTAAKNQIDGLDTVLNLGRENNGVLADFKNKYGGVWKSAFEAAKPLASLMRDEKWINLKSSVEQMQADIIKQMYGSQLTTYELQRANSYMIDFSVDRVSDMEKKMTNLMNFTTRRKEVRYDNVLGAGGFKAVTGEGYGKQSTEYDMKNEEKKNRFDSVIPSAGPTGNGGLPGVNMTPMGGYKDSFNSSQPEGGNVSGNTSSITLGGRKVSGESAALTALLDADAEFFEENGEHLFVNSSSRSTEQQQAAYDRYKRGEIAAAAKPGTSLHEKGLAFDITNYSKAKPFLEKYGFYQFDTRRDPGHFSYGSIG